MEVSPETFQWLVSGFVAAGGALIGWYLNAVRNAYHEGRASVTQADLQNYVRNERFVALEERVDEQGEDAHRLESKVDALLMANGLDPKRYVK